METSQNYNERVTDKHQENVFFFIIHVEYVKVGLKTSNEIDKVEHGVLGVWKVKNIRYLE